MKCALRSSLLILFLVIQLVYSKHAFAQPDIWVSAYYAAWMQGCSDSAQGGYLNPEDIDFGAVTHIIHFAIKPNHDGSIDYVEDCVFPRNSEALVGAAHAEGKKVLVSLGGWLSESAFLDATNDATRAQFISNLVNFMTSRGYDGIDIDWEPLSSTSVSQYHTFITELRGALNSIEPPLLLTAAVKSQAPLFAQLQDKFDQINIMTYNLSGPWSGWITWHNAPIYDGGYIFPSTGKPVPSANGLVDQYIEAGVDASKLGIGIAFFGHVWSGGTGTPTGGVTAPGQSWVKAPSVEGYVPYYEIMDTYYQPQRYRWDDAALVPYLSIDEYGSTNDKFISYDDETSCYEKINYVRNKGIGGVIVFELGVGWRPSEPVPDALLQSIKDAVWGGTNETAPQAPVLASPANGSTGVSTSVTLTWNASAGADSYTLQGSTDLSTVTFQQSGITGTSFTVDGLSENTTYYWRVNATNVYGTSEWSDVWSFTTMGSPALETIISYFTADPVSKGVLLSWETTSEYNNRGFQIQRRSPNSNRWRNVGYVSGAGTSSDSIQYSYFDKRARKSGTYIYRLKQQNYDGTFTFTSEITVQK